MRGDDRITNQNRGMASFPAEDKKISRILIKNPALKTINKNAIRDNLLTIITSVINLLFFLILCKKYFLTTEIYFKYLFSGSLQK